MSKMFQVRWMIRRDVTRVLEIDASCYPNCMTEQTLLECLRKRDVCGYVIEEDNLIVGFAILTLSKNRYIISRLAVDEHRQREGAGRSLIEHFEKRLRLGSRRESIQIEIPETNMRAQWFLRACGFLATAVLRGADDETGEDHYRFRLEACEMAELVEG